MRNGRAIIGVIALYALLLQAFVGALVPASPDFPGGGIRCKSDRSDAPDQPSCEHHACCTAVQAAGLIRPPPAVFAAAPRAERRETPTFWRDASVHGARAPPERSFRPRGPPAV